MASPFADLAEGIVVGAAVSVTAYELWQDYTDADSSIDRRAHDATFILTDGTRIPAENLELYLSDLDAEF